MSIHKALPAHGERDANIDDCAICAETVKRVPGGQGPTWVHASTGAVAGPDPAPTRSSKRVYVLHGVAKRDPDELVLMFFSSTLDRANFRRELPGKYRSVTLTGISYDDFDVELPRNGRPAGPVVTP